MGSVHLFLVAFSGILHFSHVASAALIRRPSKSECKRYARNNNACENNTAFMRLYCDKFLTCIEHDREARDDWSWGGNTNENPTRRSGVVPLESFYDLDAKHIMGSTVKFNRFRGKVVLITNVASECGEHQFANSGIAVCCRCRMNEESSPFFFSRVAHVSLSMYHFVHHFVTTLFARVCNKTHYWQGSLKVIMMEWMIYTTSLDIQAGLR